MYQLTENVDVVLCVQTGAFIPRGHWMWSEYQQFLDGGGVPLPLTEIGPMPHSPEHYRAIRDAAFAWMRSVVMARGYEAIESCASYYNSGVERYRLEARALVAWRDDVNQTLEQLVLDPPPGVITWDQVRALLPQPEAYPWPGAVELPLGAEAAPPVAIS